MRSTRPCPGCSTLDRVERGLPVEMPTPPPEAPTSRPERFVPLRYRKKREPSFRMSIHECVDLSGIPSYRIKKAIRENEIGSVFKDRALRVTQDDVARYAWAKSIRLPAIFEIRMLAQGDLEEYIAKCRPSDREELILRQIWDGRKKEEIARSELLDAESVELLAESFWRKVEELDAKEAQDS